MQCQYCNDTLSTPSNLKRHQETSNKCLTLRGLPLNKRKEKKKLCSEPECKASAEGATDKCIKHGGGKRCSEAECKASAVGKTNRFRSFYNGRKIKYYIIFYFQIVSNHIQKAERFESNIITYFFLIS